MKTRKIGSHGPEVSAIGSGCMGMSEFYSNAGETEAIRTIHRASKIPGREFHQKP